MNEGRLIARAKRKAVILLTTTSGRTLNTNEGPLSGSKRGVR